MGFETVSRTRERKHQSHAISRPIIAAPELSQHDAAMASQSAVTSAQDTTVMSTIASESTTSSASSDFSGTGPVDSNDDAVEAEREAEGHDLGKLARNLDLKMKTSAEEELVQRKSCISDDM